jgi:hypothetical protein
MSRRHVIRAANIWLTQLVSVLLALLITLATENLWLLFGALAGWVLPALYGATRDTLEERRDHAFASQVDGVIVPRSVWDSYFEIRRRGGAA